MYVLNLLMLRANFYVKESQIGSDRFKKSSCFGCIGTDGLLS